MRPFPQAALVTLSLVAAAPIAAAGQEFVNWETPHVRPLELVPGGTLLAVNTPDARLEVFDVTGPQPVHLYDVPVGVDPVTVRARTKHEAWVVNHLSDSISIVDLRTGGVVATIPTDDEPTDVVFAGDPQLAFVSCSQANTVMVFDARHPEDTPRRIPIDGEDPRAMAVSKDGRHVLVAVFESGNGSTILGGGIDPNQAGTLAFPPNVVSDPAGPHGGVNPPPNAGAGFQPPRNTVAGNPPRVGLIVKKDAVGRWMDDSGGDWTDLVSGPNADKSGRLPGWDLVDHDVAVIDVDSFGVHYVKRLMNMCMALAVHPTTGAVTVVGTDGTNEVRFEPNINGTFGRVHLAFADVAAAGSLSSGTVVDLNPHLDYSSSAVPQPMRDLSIGDPRGIAWRADGGRGFVTGMGSNNVVPIDAFGARAGDTIEVGEGPTGIALDEAGGRAYVLNKFDASISVIDLASETETVRVPFYDPSPAAIRTGRKHLYDTHQNSGLGQVACATCHVDARMDRLGWELGDPSGDVKNIGEQNRGAGTPGLTSGFTPWHPMKGPMTTQTMQDIIGKEPHHWRGDRDGLEEFGPAFEGLQGDDTTLTPQEMQEFEDFLATIHFPPNPFRNLDNSLPTDLPLDGHYTTGRFGPAGQPMPNGDAQRGLQLYTLPQTLDGPFACSTCHTLPTGMGTTFRRNFTGPYQPIPPGPNGERHHALVAVDGSTQRAIKIPHLRNIYEKTGFNTTRLSNRAGFGVLHDGSVDSIERFIAEPAFEVQSTQDVADLVAFMLALTGSDLPSGAPGNILQPPGTASQDTHTAVGTQVTLRRSSGADPAKVALVHQLVALADANAIGLIAKGRRGGLNRGYAYVAGEFQSDRASETLTLAKLFDVPAPTNELTFTAVPFGSETRMGIDRDMDGYYDTDERDGGTDPADPSSFPGPIAVTAPTAPGAVVALAVSPRRVNLTWADSSSNEDGFVIERARHGRDRWTPVASVGRDVTAYPDTGVEPGQSFVWRVRAVNRARPSGWTFARATLPPDPDAAVTAAGELGYPFVVPRRAGSSH